MVVEVAGEVVELHVAVGLGDEGDGLEVDAVGVVEGGDPAVEPGVEQGAGADVARDVGDEGFERWGGAEAGKGAGLAVRVRQGRGAEPAADHLAGQGEGGRFGGGGRDALTAELLAMDAGEEADPAIGAGARVGQEVVGGDVDVEGAEQVGEDGEGDAALDGEADEGAEHAMEGAAEAVGRGRPGAVGGGWERGGHGGRS